MSVKSVYWAQEKMKKKKKVSSGHILANSFMGKDDSHTCGSSFLYPSISYLSACGVPPQCQVPNTSVKVPHLSEPQSPLVVAAEPCPWGRNRWE